MDFNFPWHLHSAKYPESGFRATLGNSWQYTAPPTAPDQRIHTLSFSTMKRFLDSDGKLDATSFPEINLTTLEAFYNLHKLFAVFIYPSPVYGRIPCKFNKPLEIPKGMAGGNGAVEGFTLEFIECPGMLPQF